MRILKKAHEENRKPVRVTECKERWRVGEIVNNSDGAMEIGNDDDHDDRDEYDEDNDDDDALGACNQMTSFPFLMK